jgi:hypothetical protein
MGLCTESTERVEEIQTSQRTGEKVCRELVKEVQSDIVIQLTEVRDRLLAADDGGKCTKKDLYAATMAMHGEAAVGWCNLTLVLKAPGFSAWTEI